MSDRLEAGTPCYVNNAHPGIGVGTPVVLVKAVERVHGEIALVRLENGIERGVSSQSLSRMLPEEVPAWMTSAPA